VIRESRLRHVAIAIALVAAPLVVLGDVWDEPRVIDWRESAGRVAASVAALGVGVGALTAVFRRWEWGFPLAALAALPLRVPIEIGGQNANLLMPLYVVIAAGFFASVLAVWREETAPRPRATGPVRWLELALAATVVLYALQGAYSEDVSNAIENAGFFLAPFAVLFVLLGEVRWTRPLLGAALAVVGGVAVVTAAIGIGQYAVRDLFLNPELFDSNQLHQYFRVNSIFFDPNIFGRYLALAIVALAAYLAWGSARRELAVAAVAVAIALVALTFTFSITSFAALFAGLTLLAILRWEWRGLAAVAALGAVGLVGLVIAGGTPTSDIQSDRGIDSGREDLLEGGLELAEDRPLAGWGSGSFGAAFYERIEPARSIVSHSEPITVAAEQGAIGLIVYAGLLVAAFATLLDAGVRSAGTRVAVAACFVAIFVHSLGYAGFVIDPATWAVLALGMGLRARALPEPAARVVRADPPARSATISS
jgi:putative inorganic carbon (hco3(-)) transporter